MPGLVALSASESKRARVIVDLSSHASADCARATAIASVRQSMADLRSCCGGDQYQCFNPNQFGQIEFHPLFVARAMLHRPCKKSLLELPGFPQAFRQRADEVRDEELDCSARRVPSAPRSKSRPASTSSRAMASAPFTAVPAARYGSSECRPACTITWSMRSLAPGKSPIQSKTVEAKSSEMQIETG